MVPDAAAEAGHDARRGAGRDAFHRVLPAEPLAVRQALRAVLARFRRQITEAEAGARELVLAEVLNNIAEHACAGPRAGMIDLRLARRPGAICCRISDDGAAMPDCRLPPGHPPLTAAGPLPEGGFGWFLIREMVQDLTYARRAGRNHLAFRLPLGEG